MQLGACVTFKEPQDGLALTYTTTVQEVVSPFGMGAGAP